MNLKNVVLSALCCLCLASVVRADLMFDPTGDVFNPPGPDITTFSGVVNPPGTTVVFSANFAGSIAPPSAFAGNSIGGFIDLDTDRNAATGGNAPWGANQPGGNSWINFAVANGFLAGPPIALGDEFFVDLFSEASNPGNVDIFRTSDNTVVGTVPIAFTANGFSLTIPLSVLGNPGNPNFFYGLYVGDLSGFSGDRAPNGAEPAVVTPEPTSLALFGLAALGAAGYGWRRRRRVA